MKFACFQTAHLLLLAMTEVRPRMLEPGAVRRGSKVTAFLYQWRQWMKVRRVLITTLVVFLAFVSGGWLSHRPGNRDSAARDNERIFEQVVELVAQYYVDSLETADLFEMALEGMLDRLNDPYTSFLRPEAYEELSISTTGNYGGVGIRIEERDSWITIVGPLADTPGERAGLMSGDQIVEIEGMSTKGWTTQQAANVMRGDPGTEVDLTIVRAGLAEPLQYTITRALIHVNYVEGQMMVAPGVGYLNLVSVSQNAPSELRAAIDILRAEGAKSLILDLRNNPGGILEQGVAISDLFLEPGEEVVETRGRAPGASQSYTARRAENWPDMPMVVLVGPRTASAAEIIAGALQDHDRALVLGTRTFGKGTAYALIRLSETEAVTVTTSRWYTPAGRSIDLRRFRTRPLQTLAMRTAQIDSMQADTNEYRSDAGRVLPGGGGIRPDLEVHDTLTNAEQDFARALGTGAPKYRDVLARYALDLKAEDAVTSEDFTVSSAMLREFVRRLRARDVAMPDSVWAGATALVGQQLGYEIARYVFGRPAELRRRVAEDKHIREAVQLLQRAANQTDLLSLVNKGQ
jgi:carboxyl-terminal processing protease